MAETAIDRMYSEAKAVLDSLEKQSEWSLRNAAADHFRKSLLLAAASYFEDRLCDVVLRFVREKTNGSALVENFVRNKAVSRQYHSWFDWETTNANKFFSLFGADFRAAMKLKLNGSPDIQAAIAAFMELGSERNNLAHQNYATFPMEKTIDEVFALYERAKPFIDMMPEALLNEEN